MENFTQIMLLSVNRASESVSAQDNKLTGIGNRGHPLAQMQVTIYHRDKDIVMLIVALSQVILSDSGAVSKAWEPQLAALFTSRGHYCTGIFYYSMYAPGCKKSLYVYTYAHSTEHPNGL